MPSDKGIEDPSATTTKESEAVDGAKDAKVGGDYETNESNSSPQQSICGGSQHHTAYRGRAETTHLNSALSFQTRQSLACR